ncbi:MAG: Spx/MgsR family RNA polymerase-binding regulatory protein [Pseudarcicella sp.]|nr:Spx/MgsR family RNA polymerase-binding regulatory protein [Pseudarcicella sp.]MBP6410059.1 Spx/MgsR family RNA polymerase-binding regulatory protein [Pseudarcicella sp.]
MVKIYGIPNCNSVKKGLDFLRNNNIDFVFHDFKKQSLTKEKFDEWNSIFENTKLINRSGTTFKQLTEEQKSLLSEINFSFDFLISKLSVIKRPIVETSSGYLIGFDENEWIKVILNQ